MTQHKKNSEANAPRHVFVYLENDNTKRNFNYQSYSAARYVRIEIHHHFSIEEKACGN